MGKGGEQGDCERTGATNGIRILMGNFSKNPKLLHSLHYVRFFKKNCWKDSKLNSEWQWFAESRWEYVSLNVSTAVKYKILKKKTVMRRFFEVPYCGYFKKMNHKKSFQQYWEFTTSHKQVLQAQFKRFYKLLVTSPLAELKKIITKVNIQRVFLKLLHYNFGEFPKITHK